jgi:hypothetical protein
VRPFHCAHLHRPELEERREARLTFLRRTAPRRNDHDHRNPVGAAGEPDLRRQLFRTGRVRLFRRRRRSLSPGKAERIGRGGNVRGPGASRILSLSR